MKNLLKVLKWVAPAVLITIIILQQINISNLKKHRNEQSIVINELLKNTPKYSFQINPKLDVTDRSRITIYGKNNHGTQIVPSERVYLLEVKLDSTSIIKLIEHRE